MVETNIIEIETEKWNSFNKFGKFIDLTACYHLKRCQHNNCGNYTFMNKITDIYIKHFPDEKKGTGNLKKFCREYFGNFFSLATLIIHLTIIERKN